LTVRLGQHLNNIIRKHRDDILHMIHRFLSSLFRLTGVARYSQKYFVISSIN
jgi:hypothetical protein